MRLYAELATVLDRDAIVIGDGGDYVSYAGRVVDSYMPGCWLDPGPFGCLGAGPGYALAAKLARPERQVVLLLGTVEMLLARLAGMTESDRRQVVGLHPDRAPTIVAGMILLIEAMGALELDEVEVSERDILHGGALLAAGVG